MKRIFFLLLMVWSVAEAQIPNYTTTYGGYHFSDRVAISGGLTIPAGGTVGLSTNQVNRSGALKYDSTGADSGLYVYHRPYWVKVGSGTVAGAINGDTLYGTSVGLGGSLDRNTEIRGVGGRYDFKISQTNTAIIEAYDSTFTGVKTRLYLGVPGTNAALLQAADPDGNGFTNALVIGAHVTGSQVYSNDNDSAGTINIEPALAQLYAYKNNNTFVISSYLNIYPDSMTLGANQLTTGVPSSYVRLLDSSIIISSKYADQYATDSLIWRTADRTADFFLSPNFARVYSDDSIIVQSETGKYKFTDLISTIDTTDKPAVFDANGMLKKGNSWAQFGTKSFANGLYDSSGIVGIGAGVENKSTFGSWRYINTNGNRLYFKSRTSSALLWVDSSLAGGAAQLDLQGPYGGVINLKSDTTARTTNAIQWEKQGVVQVVVGNDIGPSTHHFFIDLYGSTTSINLESGGSAFAQFGTAAQYLALTAGGRLNIGSSGTIGGQTANIIGTQSVSDSVLFTSLVRLTDTTGFDVLMRNRTTGNLKMMYPGILGGGGNVTKVGTPADNQIGVWTGDGTIEGPSTFQYNGTVQTLSAAGAGITIAPASGSAVFTMTSSAGAFSTTMTYDASRNFITDYRDGNTIRVNTNNVGSWNSTGLSVNPGGGTAADFTVRSAGFNPFVFVDVSANAVGIAQSTPSAYLHLGAGTATAGTAPLKFTSGTNLTTAVAGTMEYNGTNLFFTRTGTTRESILSANAVNSVSPTSPNRTITVVIDGTTYYLAAKTTND